MRCGPPAAALAQQPLPWPAGPRALHCSAACARSAALPQQQQQLEAAPSSSGDEAAAVGAGAAVTLSGMAVKLSGGDPFLLQVEPGVEGPLAAYTEGRLRGMYRKVRVLLLELPASNPANNPPRWPLLGRQASAAASLAGRHAAVPSLPGDASQLVLPLMLFRAAGAAGAADPCGEG